MSLTREQWIEMWHRTKAIEKEIKFAAELPLIKRQRILNKIEQTKRDIQAVIGQME